MMKIFNLVPVWVWEIGLVVTLILGGMLNGKIQYYRGEYHQIKLEKALVKQTTIQSKAATEKVVVVYRDRVEKIKGDTVTLIKKVPIYVTHNEDINTPISTGFVSLWNSANKMQLPDSSNSDNEKPSLVVLSDIATQHIREASICTQTEQQRDSLKEWILTQQAVYDKKDL